MKRIDHQLNNNYVVLWQWWWCWVATYDMILLCIPELPFQRPPFFQSISYMEQIYIRDDICLFKIYN